MAANPVFAEACGLGEAALTGATPADLSLTFPAASHGELIERALVGGRPIVDVETTVPQANGTAARRWQVEYHPIQDGGQTTAVAVIAADVSDRNVAEEALRERDETLRLTLSETQTGVWSWTVGSDEIEWSPMVAQIHGFTEGATPKRFEEYIQHVHPDDRETLSRFVQHAIETGEGYEVDFRVVPPSGSVRWVWTSASVLEGAPGRPRRVVGITRDATRRRRIQEQQRFFRAAARVLMAARNEGEMLQELAEMAVGSICDWCSFELVRDGRIESVAVAHEDPSKVALALDLRERIPVEIDDEHGVPKVLRSGEPELWERVTEELLEPIVDDPKLVRILMELGLHSALIVPLRARDGVLGAVTFVSSESGRAYSAADLEFAMDVGGSIALAVENTRLLDAERRARSAAETAQERTERLQSVTESLSVTLTTNEVMAVILADGRAALDADGCLVYTLENAQLLRAGRVGPDADAAPEHLTLAEDGNHPVVQAVLTLTPSVVDGRIDLSRGGEPDAHPRQRHLVVPLISGTGGIGAVVFSFEQEHSRLTAADEALAVTIGRLCAGALERARAFEREHDVAVTLQRSMLPHSLPRVAGLRVAAKYLPGVEGLHVGGDWFDAVALEGGGLAVTVGDVVGKGVFAAGAMGQLRNAIRVYALEGYGPGDLIAHLCERSDDLTSAPFATVAHALIDPTTGTCRYACAGHPPPFLRRSDGTVERLEGGRSTPLGAGPSPRAEASVRIGPGDAIVLYSDGFVERRELPLGDGLDALEAALAASNHSGASALADDLLRVLDVESREDDVVVLVVQLVAQPANARSTEG